MKKLIFIFFILINGFNLHSQANDTDLQLVSVSIVEPITPVGGTGFIEFHVQCIDGPNVPINGVRLQLDIHNIIDFGTYEFVDNFGVWGVDYIGTEDEYRVIVIKNTLGEVVDQETYFLTLNFTGTIESCHDCGVATGNIGLTAESGMGDRNPYNNFADARFTISEPLPITLAKFDATNQDCKNIQLSWTSLNETNFKGYEIEKSLDGKVYKSIGQIGGKRNTNIKSDYVFNDTQFGNESKAYYRLKCVDLDGSISYSSIRSVDLGCAGNVDFEVFPNPASNYLKVEMKGFGKGSTKKAEILNSKGQVVQTVVVGTGMVNNINIESLISGMYVLRLIDTDGVSEKKFVKIN